MKRFVLSLIVAAGFAVNSGAMAAKPEAAKNFVDTVAGQVIAIE